MAWFVQLNGKVFGPLGDDQLRQLVAAGKIAKETEISQDRAGPWSQASRIRGLFQEPSAPPPTQTSDSADATSTASMYSSAEYVQEDPPAEVPPLSRPQYVDPSEVTGGFSTDTSNAFANQAVAVRKLLGSMSEKLSRLSTYSLIQAVVLLFLTITWAFFLQQMRQEILFEQWEYRIEAPKDAIVLESLDGYGSEGWEVVEARRASDGLGDVNYELIMKRRKR